MVRAVIGYFIFLGLAWTLSTRKDLLKNEQWKNVAWGIALQVAVVFAMTNIPVIISFIEAIAHGFIKIKDATLEGTKFVFGYIGGDELPFILKEGGAPFVFAFQALPTVILVSLLSAALTYLKVIPLLAKAIGCLFKPIFKISSNLGLVASSKIFLGQFEAAMLIKHDLEKLSKSEMFTIIALSFSTASAALMPVYATAVSEVCPDAMTHIVMSSVLGVLSTLIICKIMMPEDQDVLIEPIKNEKIYPDFITAVSKGASDGAVVWWAIVGSLIGMVALIALLNYILNALPNIFGEPLTLQRIFGFLTYPLAWLMGISDADILKVSEIIGTKFAINETVAYFDIIKTGMSKESVISSIYAITNFGNFACIGMTIGGLTALCPGRKDIPSLGAKAFIAGTLATGLSATLIQLFLS